MGAPFLTRAADGYDRRGFTVAEILRMQDQNFFGEGERFELIRGEIVPVQAKRNKHEIVRGALMEALVKLAPAHVRVRSEQTLYLSESTLVEPDIMVYPRALSLPEEVRGRDLLLVVEVADTSRHYDSGLKAQIYAEHGVARYWIVDAERQRDTLCFELVDGIYAAPNRIKVDETLRFPFAPDMSLIIAKLD